MKKSSFFALIVSAFPLLLSSSVTSAQSQQYFTKSLSLGMNDPQVQILQQLLNKDAQTQVIAVGPGSSGNETTYFGPATKRAVIKFQEKYALDILIPAGLSYGNGLVGPLTMKKLNTIAFLPSPTVPLVFTQKSIVPTLVDDTTRIDIYSTDKAIENIQNTIVSRVNSAIAIKSIGEINVNDQKIASQVILLGLSSYEGKPGTLIKVSGKGITDKTSLYFGPNYVFKDLPLLTDTLTFTVPQLPPGRYDIALKNSNGISNTGFFVITSDLTPKVTVTSITPNNINYGDTIKISGTGFTKTNNEVLTTFGKIKGVTSTDGMTLLIKFEPETLKELSKLPKQGKVYDIHVRVLNSNGYSPNIISFPITL
jgi:peptidoglycan hydrolase-like protein with peptidoglycan-binding domain